MRNDRIFVFLLVVLLPLSGCFDNAVGDAEGTDDEVTVINNYYNNTTAEYNSPPVILGDLEYGDYWDDTQGILIEDVIVSTSIAWDYDGTIVAFGVDWDMDGTIDENFSEAYDQYAYRYLNTTGDWINPQSYSEITQGRDGCYQFLNLIAVDDYGASTIIPTVQSFEEGETTGSCTNEPR